MSAERVTTTVAGRVAVIRIDDPGSHNALGSGLLEELALEIDRADGEERVRCLVVAGTDEVFALGAETQPPSERDSGSQEQGSQASFWTRLAAVGKPTVAAVSGWALGSGCELALGCDMCVAAEGTQFGQPEVTLGIIPGGGGTQRLARVLGKQRAMELVLTGRRFSAEQGHDWGLINRVSSPGQWLDDATELATELATRAPLAVRHGKQAVLAAEQQPLDDALRSERELFESTMATEDRVEGINAFAEGRPPEFEGR